MFGFSLHFSRWGALATLLLSVASIIFALPNVIPLSTYRALPETFQLPRMPLGLDLQGGTHLLYQIDKAQLRREWLNNLSSDARRALSEVRIAHSGVSVVGNQVRVTIREAEKTPEAFERLKKLSQPLSSSLLGRGPDGRDLSVTRDGDKVIVLEPTEAGLKERETSSLTRAIEVIRRRIDPTGTTEALIQQQGQDRILIQVPGLEPQEVKERVGKTARLTFNLVPPCAVDKDGNPADLPGDVISLPYQEETGSRIGQGQGAKLSVCKTPIVTGDELIDAAQSFDRNSRPAISFRFNTKGAIEFGRVTSDPRNIGRPFAIVLDNQVISAPSIREPITQGTGEITGSFTVEEAKRLALLLKSGALPVNLSIIEERSVGPSLGADSIEAGKMAAIVGFVLVSGVMIGAYGLFGMFSVVALVVNIAIIMACLSLFHATLTLPGIAGIVLTMGVAVDANVLIYERIREELKQGKGMISAIEAGFDRAYATIIDSHLTGLLAALILYAFGSGTVRGFAVTLSFGIVSSLFTAITVTRLMVSTWLRQARPAVLQI